jgi:Caspase domain/Putative peptidoglycan binding domain
MFHRYILWFLLSAAFATPTLGSDSTQSRGAFAIRPTDMAKSITLYRKSYAFVVGIDAYTGGWPRLSNAVRDAQEVAKELAQRGFDVTTITNPTSNQLSDKLEEFMFAKGADPASRLFIWFAGHGHTVNGESYLIPADAPLPKSDWKFRRKSLSLRVFSRLMREARSKHVLAVFDACFAGNVFMTARALPPDAITRATTLAVRQFVSSGDFGQEVSDDGMFRKLFIGALNGNEPSADANKDGFITGTELGFFLSDKVTNLTRSRQTPRSGKLRAVGLDRGDFVFRLPGTPVSPSPVIVAPSTTQPPSASINSLPATRPATKSWSVSEIQSHLLRLGYTSSRVDGVLGRKTVEGVKQFQNSIGVIADGQLSFQLLAALRTAKPPEQIHVAGRTYSGTITRRRKSNGRLRNRRYILEMKDRNGGIVTIYDRGRFYVKLRLTGAFTSRLTFQGRTSVLTKRYWKPDTVHLRFSASGDSVNWRDGDGIFTTSGSLRQ